MSRQRINRGELFKSLGLTQKIPADHEKTYLNVHIPTVGETLTITVVKSNPPIGRNRWGGAIKSSKHRVFYTCTKCGKQVPTGRYAQHDKVHQ